MGYLSPTTLTTDEQRLILRVTAKSQRDHVIISLALGTGLASICLVLELMAHRRASTAVGLV